MFLKFQSSPKFCMLAKNLKTLPCSRVRNGPVILQFQFRFSRGFRLLDFRLPVSKICYLTRGFWFGRVSSSFKRREAAFHFILFKIYSETY